MLVSGFSDRDRRRKHPFAAPGAGHPGSRAVGPIDLSIVGHKPEDRGG